MPDKSVSLIATKAYTYGTLKLTAGQTFKAKAEDVDLLFRLQMAKKVEEAEKPTRRRYRRRDLEAE
jgi:hypothetical protein